MPKDGNNGCDVALVRCVGRRGYYGRYTAGSDKSGARRESWYACIEHVSAWPGSAASISAANGSRLARQTVTVTVTSILRWADQQIKVNTRDSRDSLFYICASAQV